MTSNNGVWADLIYCTDDRCFKIAFVISLVTRNNKDCSAEYNRPLAFLAPSVCMRPNFQGLLWDEFGGLGENKLKTLFLLS
jgi:hypothetical protein